MKVLIALGGNALLQRGEEPTAEAQRRNVAVAAAAVARVAREHQVVVTHGNGPQVGLLALRSEAVRGDSQDPLDLLGAETEGMIGYM
ncbi:MAG TPA: carbamate kinase, partial [Longimicrobiales bacterium]|nr:carbamate kinase [Longimicrobiales bacterium]